MRTMLAAFGSLAVALAACSAEPRPNAPQADQAAPAAGQLLPLSADAARDLLSGGALLVDVREPHELTETGKLRGALNLPLTALKQLSAHGSTPADLGAAKDRPVILYCRSGRRSAEAGEILLRQGFTRVYNLGGFDDAVKAGLPTA